MQLSNAVHPINVEQAELWLKRKCNTSEGPYLRPFAPNAKWNTAEVFIVGLNPATPFRHEFESFDHYWDALIRNPEEYYRIYRREHLKSEEEKSRTSRRIAAIIESVSRTLCK